MIERRFIGIEKSYACICGSQRWMVGRAVKRRHRAQSWRREAIASTPSHPMECGPFPEYVATDSCVLCGDPFPTASIDPKDVSQWPMYLFQAGKYPSHRYELKCLTNGDGTVLDLQTARVPHVTKTAVIPRLYAEVDVCTEQVPGSEDHPTWVILHRDGEALGQRAYCFHMYCWHCLQRSLGSEKNVDPQTILRLARSTTQTYTARLNLPTDAAVLSRGLEELIGSRKSGSFQKGACCGLTELLQRMRELPTEILFRVFAHLEPCTVRSLLSLQVGYITHLFDRLAQYPRREIPSMVPVTSSMTAHMTYIRGTKYVCGLQSGTRLFGYKSDVTEPLIGVVPEDTMRIAFTLGLNGIKAIQIMGRTRRSDSDGHAPLITEAGTWIGILKLPAKSREMQVSWDGSMPCEPEKQPLTVL